MKAIMTIRIAAALGFLGVALGAFGAHGLKAVLEANERAETWETAVLYHLLHSVALLALGLLGKPPRVAVISFLLGVIVFSGSLYVLSLTNQTWLGAITPLGGVAFLVGWASLAIKPPGRSVGSAG